MDAPRSKTFFRKKEWEEMKKRRDLRPAWSGTLLSCVLLLFLLFLIHILNYYITASPFPFLHRWDLSVFLLLLFFRYLDILLSIHHEFVLFHF